MSMFYSVLLEFIFDILEYMCYIMHEVIMMICYNPLWKLLIDKNLKKTAFRDAVGISNGTLAKLSKNEPVALTVIEKICLHFSCNIEDVIQITR